MPKLYLHTKIFTRIKDFDSKIIKVETTPGRMMLGDLLPNNKNINFDLINKVLTKKDILEKEGVKVLISSEKAVYEAEIKLSCINL